MDPVLKAEWIDALTSGEYPQGNHYLNKDGKFCCLGVLCELLVDKGLLTRHDEDPDMPAVYGQETESQLLPREVADMLKITQRANIKPFPIVAASGPINIYALTEANDEGMTFAQIAEIIEREF